MSEVTGGCGVEKLEERLELPMGPEAGLEGSNLNLNLNLSLKSRSRV